MLKYVLILLLIHSATIPRLQAQDTLRVQRSEQLRQLLNMTQEEFKAYRDSLKPYNQKLTNARQGQYSNQEAKNAAIARAIGEKKAYMEAHLSVAQRQTLREFNRNSVPSSPRQTQRRELNERLTRRGIHVVSDSLP